MNTRRAVLTGRGVCSPLGCDWTAFAEAVRSGREAPLAPYPGSTTGARCHLISDAAVLGDALERGQEPLALLTTEAARQALAEAGLEGGDGVGFVANTLWGPSTALESFLERLEERGPRAARPAQFVDTLISMPASRAGIALGLRGSTAVLGGGSAFELALDWVREGRQDVVVAGGSEALSPKCLRYHEAQAARSGCPRAIPAQAAAFGVLEDAEHAERRGARPLAEVLGAGAASEAQDESVPWGADPEGRAQAAAMRLALEDAAIEPDEVVAVCLAAGDDASEAAEAAALRDVFGGHGASLALLRPKRFAGEALGASEAVAVLAALAGWEAGTVGLVNAFEMGGAVSSLAVRVA